MTQPEQTSVPIRLTFREARRIYGGIRLLKGARYFNEHPDPYAAIIPGYDGRHGFDYGRFDAELNRSLVTAFAKIRSVSGTSKRLRITVFEIAACMLGLRWTATRLQRGKFVPPGVKLNVPFSTQIAMAQAGTWGQSLRREIARVRPKYLAAVERLMRKLENSRRRAKRAYLQAHGEEHYREYEERWKGHVRWVRVHLMEVGIRSWRAQQPGRKQLYGKRVERWVATARKDLAGDKLPPPPEDELVAVVKKALRSAKRFQRTLSRSLGLSKRQDLLNEHIWNIINRDCLSWVKYKARQDLYDRIQRAAGMEVVEDTIEEKPQGKKRRPHRKKSKAK